MRGQLLLKGVELGCGLRDLYLANIQYTENRIEYHKTFIQAAAALHKADVVDRHLEILKRLLGVPTGKEEQKSNWSEDPFKVEQGMDMLKNWKPKITIERVGR